MIPNEYFSKARKVGFFLGLLTMVVWFYTKSNPEFTEHFYSRLFYPFLASHLALFGSYMPFALTSFIFAAIILWLLAIPFVQYRQNKELGITGVLTHIALSFISSAAFFIFLFSLTFLLNHHRYTEEKLYGLDFEMDKEKYQALVETSVAHANMLSEQFEKNERGCTEINFSLSVYDALIEQEQIKFLHQNNLPAVANAKTRYFLLTYIWSGMGFGGQYQPLVGQTNITKQLPDYSKPFVIAHERGHLNGFASEAGASLFAAQTLFHAEDSRLKYLGLLGMWLEDTPDNANEQVARDLQCWNEDIDNVYRFKSKDFFMKINDIYLKTSGHKDGIGSYDRGELLGLKYYYLNFVEKTK